MIVGRLTFDAHGSVYHVAAHEDDRFDVMSPDLTLDHIFLSASQAANLLVTLLTNDNLDGLTGEGPPFEKLAAELSSPRFKRRGLIP